MLMHQDPSDRIVHVKSCVPGGAAERDGHIQAGDMIASVNGRNAFGLSVQETRSMIVGPQGSTVVVGFHRPTGEVFERTLVRGTPEYFEAMGPRVGGSFDAASQPALRSSYGLTSSRNNDPLAPPVPLRSSRNQDYPSQMPLPMRSSIDIAPSHLAGYVDPLNYTAEQEVARLRGRVNELEGENNNLKDELYRNRQWMEKDRDSSLRYAKEMEALHNKYADQISQLQGMLQQSEVVNSELQQQLLVARQREEEMRHMLNSGKQHTGEREQYFNEVRERFDSELTKSEQIVRQEREARERAEKARQLAEETLEVMMGEVEKVRQEEESRRAMEEQIRSTLHASNKRLMEASKEGEVQRAEAEAAVRALEAWHRDFFEPTTKSEKPATKGEQTFVI